LCISVLPVLFESISQVLPFHSNSGSLTSAVPLAFFSEWPSPPLF